MSFFLGQDDLITALEYDLTGEYLGWGDQNGRVTVLKLDSEVRAQVMIKGSTSLNLGLTNYNFSRNGCIIRFSKATSQSSIS